MQTARRRAQWARFRGPRFGQGRVASEPGFRHIRAIQDEGSRPLKARVLGLIAGIAAFMAFMIWRGECPDGTIVHSEAECRRSGVISDAACRTVLQKADSLMRRAATVYPTLDQCMQHMSSASVAPQPLASRRCRSAFA